MFKAGYDTEKSWFFGWSEWQQILEPAVRDALITTGRQAVQSAKRRIRRRGRKSRPGEPPTSWTGKLRDNINFALTGRESVIVGPMRVTSSQNIQLMHRNTIPSTLEFGGSYIRGGPEVGLQAQVFHNGGSTVRIQPRPYMLPTFKHMEKKYQANFAGVVGMRSVAVARSLEP